MSKLLFKHFLRSSPNFQIIFESLHRNMPILLSENVKGDTI